MIDRRSMPVENDNTIALQNFPCQLKFACPTDAVTLKLNAHLSHVLEVFIFVRARCVSRLPGNPFCCRLGNTRH